MFLANSIERVARLYPDAIASVDGGRSRNWAQFRDRVARAAAMLQGQGIGAGERVAILAANSDRYMELLYAVPWAGAVLLPMNTRLAAPELEYQLNHAGAAALIYDSINAEKAGALAPKVPGLRRFFALDGSTIGGPASWTVEELMASAVPVPDAGRAGSDLLGIFYTGGTTGLPKGVMLSHANIHAQSMVHMLDLGWSRETVYLHLLPMFHLADILATYALVALGGSSRFMAKVDMAALLPRLADDGITAAALAPTIVGWLLDHPQLGQYDLSRLRDVAYGTAPIPEPVLRKAVTRWPHVRFTQIYGQSECGGSTTVLRPEDHVVGGPHAARLASAGRATWGVDVRIVDDADREVPPGTLGEIVTRGPAVMQGYWNDPDQTAFALRGGWLHTADAGTMDADGYVTIMDRKKDMIVSGGENVYSAEVENALASFPGVSQVAVIGIPHEEWGEAVHAILVPLPGVTLDRAAILAHCRARIAGYKCPKSIEVRAEPLPLSGVNKIQKTALREPYWRGRTRRVN
jgi:long-chain acyl-CoA synthetase